jgi:hypothetical protein
MTDRPNYEQLLIDATRSRDNREKGLATRPERALRAKRFAELRTPPWRLQLALALTWCARTGQLDPSGDWPYERLDEGMRSGRLHANGTHLPDDILIDDAIDEVLAIVARASCEHQRVDEAVDWYSANIATPSAFGGTPSRWSPTNSEGCEVQEDQSFGDCSRPRAKETFQVVSSMSKSALLDPGVRQEGAHAAGR